eukprot:438562-Amphidinium_carterae.1
MSGHTDGSLRVSPLHDDDHEDMIFVSNSTEVTWRRASQEEKQAFLRPGGADESEWKGIQGTMAIPTRSRCTKGVSHFGSRRNLL